MKALEGEGCKRVDYIDEFIGSTDTAKGLKLARGRQTQYKRCIKLRKEKY